jgi:hypothetical protein
MAIGRASRPMMRSRHAGRGAGGTTGRSISTSRSSSTRCRGTLIVRAVHAVTDTAWVLLYVKRWLAAPLQHPNGALIERTKGTPQGSAVWPILANLFMHYAFDAWMAREHPGCPFERYADDAIVHGRTRRQAEYVLGRIAARMAEVGLKLNPDKTRIVYCKDSNRRDEHEHISFTFLEFAFRPREAINRETGQQFTSLSPAISPRGAQGQRRPAPRDADPPAHRPDAQRPGGVAEPDRRRVDALLRPVLPVGARSSTRVPSGRSGFCADDCCRRRSSGLDLRACCSSVARAPPGPERARAALQAHGDHRPGERAVGAPAGVLLSLGKPGVELGRVAKQPLVAVAHWRDVRVDHLGEQRLDLAVTDPAGAIALLDGRPSQGRRMHAAARRASTCRDPSAAPVAWSR